MLFDSLCYTLTEEKVIEKSQCKLSLENKEKECLIQKDEKSFITEPVSRGKYNNSIIFLNEIIFSGLRRDKKYN